jgi:hypothetical protein
MSSPLEQERKFFREHRAEWEKTYAGKFVLVKGEALVGTFDAADTAVSEGIRKFGTESFLVRNVGEKEEEIRIPALMLGLLNANSTLPT